MLSPVRALAWDCARLQTGFIPIPASCARQCEAMSSPPTTPMSQASTRFGLDSSISLDNSKNVRRRAVEKVKQLSTSQDIFLFLVAFRILSALSVKTFFQPDEYFQSLEPAWQIAFGEDSGAWITWVWAIPHAEKQKLTSRTGVEESAEICNTSSAVCGSLFDRISSCKASTPVSFLPGRPSGSCAESRPGSDRCGGGLLYLEARRASLWNRE